MHAELKKIIRDGVDAFHQNQFQQAEVLFRSALKIEPNNAHVLNLLGATLTMNDQYREALKFQKQAIEYAPNVAQYQHNLGTTYLVTGNAILAEKHYRKSVELKPDYTEAYFNLVAVKKFKENDPIIRQMRELFSSNLGGEEKSFLHFAYAKVMDDIKNYDEAFQHYRLANKTRNVEFDKTQHINFIDNIIEYFNADTIRKYRAQSTSDASPIFILGMPRSGTTLVEQILSAHSSVSAAGELPDISAIADTIQQHHPDKCAYPYYMKDIDARVINGFAQAYLKRTQSIFPQAEKITDKMPQNFLYLGLIHIMFPNAIILHCRRNPIDTCLSCYFQRFKTGLEYSYSLKSLTVYYQQYHRLMKHWQDCDIPIYDVDYEELISSPEINIKNLIKSIGLSWQSDCLNSHEVERPIKTASFQQVRKPIYKSSMERWKKYQDHVDVLIKHL